MKYINLFLNWVVSLLFIPRFIEPKTDKKIWFLHKHGYFFSGNYVDGKYVGDWVSTKKRARYDHDNILCWGFLNLVELPELKSRKKHQIQVSGLTIVTDRRSKEVWDYTDALGKKMKVTYDQRKNLEKNPLWTSVGNKRELIKNQAEKKINQQNEEHKKATGNYLYN